MAEVAKRAPVRTGEYKNAITWTYNARDKAVVVYVQPPHYRRAHILEFGTTGKTAQRAQPHFRPAFDSLQREFEQRCKEIDIKES